MKRPGEPSQGHPPASCSSGDPQGSCPEPHSDTGSRASPTPESQPQWPGLLSVLPTHHWTLLRVGLQSEPRAGPSGQGSRGRKKENKGGEAA